MKHFFLSFIAVISLSVSLYADTNNTVCQPLLQEGVGIARNTSETVAEFVHVTMPQAMQTIAAFTNQLQQTTDVINSKVSYGFLAAAGALGATSVTIVALTTLLIWKCGGEKLGGWINAFIDRRIGDRIIVQEHLRRSPASSTSN